jgi:hypothetical protein
MKPLPERVRFFETLTQYDFIEFCFFKATPGVVLGGTWALTPPPDPLPSPAQRERGATVLSVKLV